MHTRQGSSKRNDDRARTVLRARTHGHEDEVRCERKSGSWLHRRGAVQRHSTGALGFEAFFRAEGDRNFSRSTVQLLRGIDLPVPREPDSTPAFFAINAIDRLDPYTAPLSIPTLTLCCTTAPDQAWCQRDCILAHSSVATLITALAYPTAAGLIPSQPCRHHDDGAKDQGDRR